MAYGQPPQQPYPPRPPYGPPPRRKGMPPAALAALIAAPIIVIVILVGALLPDDQPAATPEPSKAVASSPAASASAGPSRTDKARAYLKSNFAATSWYRHVKGLHYQADQIWVDTDLGTSSAARGPAGSICTALSVYLLTEQGREKFGGVRVAAGDGQRLVWRQGVSGSC